MSTLRVRRLLGILLIILSTAPRAVLAQDTGIVTGTVVDTTGQVIPGATVTLTMRPPATRAPPSPTSAASSRSAPCSPAPTRWPPNWPASENTSGATTSSTPAGSSTSAH